jgi:hypothetical protein
VIPIAWGLPDEALFKDAQKGEVVLGGCVVGDHDPSWHCKACDRGFGHKVSPQIGSR